MGDYDEVLYVYLIRDCTDLTVVNFIGDCTDLTVVSFILPHRYLEEITLVLHYYKKKSDSESHIHQMIKNSCRMVVFHRITIGT